MEEKLELSSMMLGLFAASRITICSDYKSYFFEQRLTRWGSLTLAQRNDNNINEADISRVRVLWRRPARSQTIACCCASSASVLLHQFSEDLPTSIVLSSEVCPRHKIVPSEQNESTERGEEIGEPKVKESLETPNDLRTQDVISSLSLSLSPRHVEEQPPALTFHKSDLDTVEELKVAQITLRQKAFTVFVHNLPLIGSSGGLVSSDTLQLPVNNGG
ncbi:hypothetical protein F2P81_019594 [Scophthalmus maximus]|uniref:Uncharacterized protein n=1 Tax=Scophthalmus maximus TaxID=52904 RepID=A0A6A4S619_SCOMX|nr:hypothetical protein F2P81_019594 [Scophthalmus maximus]